MGELRVSNTALAQDDEIFYEYPIRLGVLCGCLCSTAALARITARLACFVVGIARKKSDRAHIYTHTHGQAKLRHACIFNFQEQTHCTHTIHEHPGESECFRDALICADAHISERLLLT